MESRAPGSSDSCAAARSPPGPASIPGAGNQPPAAGPKSPRQRCRSSPSPQRWPPSSPGLDVTTTRPAQLASTAAITHVFPVASSATSSSEAHSAWSVTTGSRGRRRGRAAGGEQFALPGRCLDAEVPDAADDQPGGEACPFFEAPSPIAAIAARTLRGAHGDGECAPARRAAQTGGRRTPSPSARSAAAAPGGTGGSRRRRRFCCESISTKASASAPVSSGARQASSARPPGGLSASRPLLVIMVLGREHMIMWRPYSRTATRRTHQFKNRERPGSQPGRFNGKLKHGRPHVAIHPESAFGSARGWAFGKLYPPEPKVLLYPPRPKGLYR